jgi:crotonobetainyl-CoA:carnitine CoA-transferase CaiB-like acyl-CoA transferase
VTRVKESKTTGFLGDTLVIDLSDKRGSFCSKLLSDLGARVIRIEPPGGGPSPQLDLLSFVYRNAHKERLTLDPDGRRGRATLRKLLKKADVLIETLSTDCLRKLRLSPASLSRFNPSLIHVSITGFGRNGRMARYRWNNALASAFGGQTYLSGSSQGKPNAPPGDQTYYSTSLFGAVAVLLALRERMNTGGGRLIDLSAQEAVASTLDHVMVDWFHGSAITHRQGNIYGNNAFVILPSSDGFIQITILQNWETLVELMASEGQAGDLTKDSWRERTYRETHFDHIVQVVGNWTRTHTKHELFELGQAMRFPWAPVCSPEEVLKSPQLAARGFFGPTGIENKAPFLPGLPYRFSLPSPASGKVPPQENASDSAHRPILHGIRVLDFTWMLAGPYATRILADSGAEVIKIQSTKTAKGGEDNLTGYFATWNRNKRSITLDLDYPEAREIVLKLARMSDVVVESFSPRIMANWGLAYDDLRPLKPDLVMASISAMGRTGPWRDYVGFGPTFHALSGLTHLMSTGLRTPICLGHAYGDTLLGLYAALAIIAALHERDSTGEGRHVDLSGYEAVCSVLAPTLLQAAAKDSPKERDDGFEPFEGYYRCRGNDRWIVVTADNEEEWQGICRVVGTSMATREGKEKLHDFIGQWAIDRTAKEAVRLLQKASVPAGMVQDAADLAKDRQLARRRYFVHLQHPVLGSIVSDRTPLFFGRPEPDKWRAAPLLGEDNRYVLGRIVGLSEEELISYSKRGIVG